MLNVLIIDDEKLVRTTVRQSIEWEAHGMQVAGEASSARMGMEMIEELHVDMIVMDIKMPGMSGLDCSQLVLEKYPRMKIIILSGHDDFEYASKGIHIGVFEYLLKPVNAEELERAVIKARDAIREERNHQKDFDHYKEELKKHAAYIRDRQLSELVSSSRPSQYLDSLSYLGVELSNEIFQVFLIEPKIQNDVTEEDKIVLKMLIRKLVEDYYDDIPGIYTVDSGSDWIIVLNNASEYLIYDSGERLIQYLEDNTETEICIDVGNTYRDLGKVRESYREAQNAAKYRFSSGESIIYFRDIYPYYDTEINVETTKNTIYELGNTIRIGETEAAEKKLQDIVGDFKKTGGKKEQAVILALEIFAEIMKVLTELKISTYSDSMNYSAVVGEVFARETFEEVEEYLRKSVQEACTFARKEVADKEKSLVHRVADAIKEQYADEEMSLNTLAQKYFVNPSYLSRVFKEKTGNTFTGYLFEVRMKEAQNLVRCTDMKAYEIAERVGIVDPHYFSSCFKKYTGMSVAEFKKKNGITIH